MLEARRIADGLSGQGLLVSGTIRDSISSGLETKGATILRRVSLRTSVSRLPPCHGGAKGDFGRGPATSLYQASKVEPKKASLLTR